MEVSQTAIIYSGFPVTVSANSNNAETNNKTQRANWNNKIHIANRSLTAWFGTDPPLPLRILSPPSVLTVTRRLGISLLLDIGSLTCRSSRTSRCTNSRNSPSALTCTTSPIPPAGATPATPRELLPSALSPVFVTARVRYHCSSSTHTRAHFKVSTINEVRLLTLISSRGSGTF